MVDVSESQRTPPSASVARMAVSSAGQVATLALAVGTTIVTSRWLGPAGRGSLSLVIAACTVGSTVLSFGVTQAIAAYSARREMSHWDGFRAALVVATIAAALYGITIGLGRELLPVEAPWVQWAVPLGTALVTVSAIQTAAAVALGRVALAAANTVSTAFALLVGYTAGWLAGDTVLESGLLAVGVWLVSQALGDVVGWGLLLARPVDGIAARPQLGEFLAFGMRAYFGTLLGQLNLRVDVLVLGMLAPVVQVGLYGTAMVAMSVVVVAPGAIGQALARPFGGGGVIAKRQLRIGMMGAFWGSLAVGVAASLVAPLLVPLLLGSEFAPVSGLVAVMVPGMALFSTAFVSSAYFNNALRRPGLNTFIAGVALCLDLILLLVLAPRIGAMGAAVASTVAYGVAGCVNLIVARRAAAPEVVVTLVPSRQDLRDIMNVLRRRRTLEA